MKLVLLFSLAALFTATASSEELLGVFDFEDVAHRSAARVENNAVTISDLAFGVPASHAVGFSQGARNIYFAAAPLRDKYPEAKWPRSAEEAVEMDYYAEFHFATTPGFMASLNALALKYGGSAHADTGPGVAPFYVHVQLRSSVDNYEVALGESAPFKVYPLKPGSNTEGSWRLDLSSQPLLEKIDQKGVVFRLYVWVDGLTEEPTYSNSIRIDDIQLFGTTNAHP